MSIIHHIQTIETGNSPELLRIPAPKGQTGKRTVFLARAAQREMAVGVGGFIGRGNIMGVLERWITGQRIIVRLKGRKSVGFLARLDSPPEEVWEFRVTQPTPQGRLFCRFAAKDLLIVTHMHTRSMLKDPGSPEWNDAMKRCVEEWQRIFPGMPPHSGAGIGDYISAEWIDGNA